MEWRASHILVKDRALAQELVKRCKQGGSFESLARDTRPVSNHRAANLGWFGPGQEWRD